MLIDTRLWKFTRGVRLRIAATVAMGVVSSLVGIGRLALLGWLLARVFAGDTFADLIVPLAAVAAVMVLRGWIEHTRAMVAHRTAIRVQLALRKLLYGKVVALGPAHFGLERTGAVMISMIDGVEQLETYFGQYLPQLLVSLITPLVVFALLAFFDFPVAAVMFGFAMFTLFAPSSFQRWEAKSSTRRSPRSESTPTGSARKSTGTPSAKLTAPRKKSRASNASMTSQGKAKRRMPCTSA